MAHGTGEAPTTPRESFDIARNRLTEARLRQRQKDTPVNRAAVAARLAEIDTVLDAHLVAEHRVTRRDDDVVGVLGGLSAPMAARHSR